MLSAEERVEFRAQFLAYLHLKIGRSGFSYQSFPKLDYDEKVLKILIEELRREGEIQGSDPFRLT